MGVYDNQGSNLLESRFATIAAVCFICLCCAISHMLTERWDQRNAQIQHTVEQLTVFKKPGAFLHPQPHLSERKLYRTLINIRNMTEGSDGLISADCELAQCETEVSTLLQIISDLNRKMDSLIPRETQACEAPVQVSGCVIQPSLTSPACSLAAVDTGTTSVEPETRKKSKSSEGGSSDPWTELQQILVALETSSGQGRKMHNLQTQDAERVQANHLSAAQETWVHATQVLEEMESDLGITYPSALPPDERRQYQRDTLSLYKQNQDLSASLKSRQEELKGAERTLVDLEDEKNWLQQKLADLKKKWMYRVSQSPPLSPSLTSSRTSSPCFSSPPYPGSPLLPRKLSSSSPDSPPSPRTVDSVLQSEIDKLQRCLERLKARNERLNAALFRRKGESEQLSMSLSRHEADSSALHMALTYCEECEEAYSDLYSLYEAKLQQNADAFRPQSDASMSPVEKIDLRIKSSSSTPEGTTEPRPGSLSEEEFEDKTGVILQRISRLKQDRAGVCIPQQGEAGEGKISPDTGTLAGVRGRTNSLSKNTKQEKAALMYELVTVREEMSELRGNLRLLDKDRRCLELALMVQSDQDSAEALILDSLREELSDRRATQQRIAENRVKLDSGGGIPGPRNHSLLRELQAALQREQAMRKRVTALRESLDSTLTDSTNQRRINRDEIARLTLRFNKILSTYRNSRKKHQEQLWRLEKQILSMSERYATREAGLNATLEAIECRKEETVL
nr:colorectal mutant cancer protein isoform X2 [Misgurnus anguillicaudatus]